MSGLDSAKVFVERICWRAEFASALLRSGPGNSTRRDTSAGLAAVQRSWVRRPRVAQGNNSRSLGRGAYTNCGEISVCKAGRFRLIARNYASMGTMECYRNDRKRASVGGEGSMARSGHGFISEKCNKCRYDQPRGARSTRYVNQTRTETPTVAHAD